jgi:hypothetical protein
MLLATAALSGIAISSYSHDGWYSIKKSDDIEKISNSKEISKKILNKVKNKDSELINVNHDTATVKSYKNGTVIVKNSVSKWTFDTDNNVPSDDAVRFYKNYGVDFNEMDEIPVCYFEYTNDISLTDDQYLSDCGEWVLESDSVI